MCTSKNRENFPDGLVLENNSRYSPSGNYKLTLLVEKDDNNREYYYFTISSYNNDILYTSDEKYYKRHTLFLLWEDNEDIVWCYSGDIGTFYWIYENGFWEKHYNNPDVEVPEILKKLRPNIFLRK
jgi:hypothetical protein